MGRLDGMAPEPVPATWVEELRERAAGRDQLERELAGLRAQLEDREGHIANMEASVFWRLRDLVHRALRRP
jgi:hypothetical protein